MIVFWILSALVSSIFTPAPTNTNVLPAVAPTPVVEQIIVTSMPTLTLTPIVTPTPTPTVVFTPTKTVVTPTVTKAPVVTSSPVNSGLSNDNYYTNSQGNEVHSPAYSDSVPPGASAVCGDGTYSFSQSRRGTCSHHGGVAQWL